jgi:hypothetical protein
MKRDFNPVRPDPTQPVRGHVPASPDRWVPPLSLTAHVRARALSLPLSGGANLSALVHSRTRSLPLSARWSRSVSADRPFAYASSLASRPHLSATSPSRTSRPCSPPWTRPRRAFPGHSPTRPTSFWSLHPLAHSPCSIAPQKTPLAPLSHTVRTPVELHRGPPSVPWPSSSPYRVCCPGELRLLTNNTRHPLVCPQPLYFSRFTLTGPSSCSRRPPPLTRGLAVSLPSFKRPRALSQGNPAPHVSDFPFPAPVHAQSLAGVDVPHRRAPPL